MAQDAIAKLVPRYAPLVVLHRDDKLRPSSATRFVERSALLWATGRGLVGTEVPEAKPKVDPDRLGVGGDAPEEDDPYTVRGFRATDLTRPLHAGPSRPSALPVEQGFFLRLRKERDARGDESTSADRTVYAGSPAYWDYDPVEKSITYWLFYPGSSPPLGILRAHEQIVPGTRGAPPDPAEAAQAAAALEEFERAYPTLAQQAVPPTRGTRGIGDVFQRLNTVAAGVRALLRDDDVLHEGDWERVTVYLNRSRPLAAAPESIVFYRHSTNTPRAWGKVEKKDTHPVVYSAIGSHASLPSANFGFIDVGDPKGLRWRTWQDLPAIAEQPWYGFGGAWGRLGKVRDATGPLGPGTHWKHPAPRPAV
jgi:hypothetical protein